MNSKSFESPLYAVYKPELPIATQRYLSYHLEFTSLDEIATFPSELESTSLVLAYGHDLFFTKVQPDNPFDILDEDF